MKRTSKGFPFRKCQLLYFKNVIKTSIKHKHGKQHFIFVNLGFSETFRTFVMIYLHMIENMSSEVSLLIYESSFLSIKLEL